MEYTSRFKIHLILYLQLCFEEIVLIFTTIIKKYDYEAIFLSVTVMAANDFMRTNGTVLYAWFLFICMF